LFLNSIQRPDLKLRPGPFSFALIYPVALSAYFLLGFVFGPLRSRYGPFR
jgi:hypothetical protein